MQNNPEIEQLIASAVKIARAKHHEYVMTEHVLLALLQYNPFRKVLEKSNLRAGQYGQLRTLYSLRHTAITFRLLYGNGIDLLTLARNARTSVEMIERFYSSDLTAEMNIEMLQSKRSKQNLI